MWGVSQDRTKKGRPREGWDLPKAHSKGMAKWGLGPRDLPTQARVLTLDLELPQGHNILPAHAWCWEERRGSIDGVSAVIKHRALYGVIFNS